MTFTFLDGSHSDNEPGYIYMIEAVGFGGVFPGKLVRRIKIGLSRDPELRRLNFVNSQPPCDFKIIATIFVEDMAQVEKQLHEIFIKQNVKLEKSKEWFDLDLIQYYRCLWELHTRETKTFTLSGIPWKGLTVGFLALPLAVFVAMSVTKFEGEKPQQPTIVESQILK